MMKHLLVICLSLGLVMALIIAIAGLVQATYYEVENVPMAATITSGGTSGAVPGAVNAGAYIHAHEVATLGGIPLPPGYGYATQWIQTQDFTEGVWNNANHTARDISLPPDTANISQVFIDLRWQPSNIPDYKVGVSLDSGSTWMWDAFNSARTIGSNTSEAHNITSFTAWTPQILKSPDLCVKILSYSYGVSPAVYCYLDYLGIYYIWSGPDPPINETIIPGGDVPGTFATPDVIGLMGMTGFIGMIGIPAASIWFLRHDGGSKIHAGVMALIGFTVCFGFFYASINGG